MAALKEITLEGLEFSIRGFEEIRYETRIQSPEPAERIKGLVEEAERHCYVLSTLRRAAKVSARIVLNGALLMEFTHPPG